MPRGRSRYAWIFPVLAGETTSRSPTTGSRCPRSAARAGEITTFCSTTYGVTFPLTEKIDVNGPERHPLYATLTVAADASGEAGDVQWNFEKFLLTPSGTIAARSRPRTDSEA
jgi:glutathione peroxidase-family protein